jgi:uncharacterized protein (DUF1778 family)
MSKDRIDLRVSAADLKRWRMAAALQGVSLSEWIRAACDAGAISKSAFDELRKAIP